MKYTVVWNRFPTGHETDEMISNSRDFETFEKALDFLNGRVKLIKSTHWAGGYIEEDDFPYRTVYFIDYCGEREDYREELVKSQLEQEIQEVQSPEIQVEETPEAQKPTEDFLTFPERAGQALIEILKILAESAKIDNIRPPPI